MNTQIEKELQHFIDTAERTVADIASKVELARYLIAESKKGSTAWAPSFPASFPTGMLEIQAQMVIINYLQNAESMAKVSAANPMHPLPKRVQIPPYIDRWMMGDRYGEMISTFRNEKGEEIARVKLDKSGVIVRVILNDCALV